ncbi:hypothetical protein ABT173_38460 [Streptomyces sp. NPDC001795]|uniref:hypothetical protein n=1 Tax=unclassified Streptomyces TaxID=2593676 RepID=UPI0033254D20
MWPGEQPPGGGQSPQHPAAGQSSNPYQQPGYHQPNPYQQPQSWSGPPQPPGAPTTPPPSGGDRTKLIAILAAAAVVVAAGVTGFVLLGGSKKDRVDPGPTQSVSSQPSADNPRNSGTEQATIKGWKVVVNPKSGIAFDVPPQWELKSPDYATYVSDNNDPEDKPLAAMRAPAFLKQQWCASDENKDGTKDYSPLAAAGSKGNNGAKNTEEIASLDPEAWVYGQYTQPSKAKVKSGAVESFTTNSGIKGSLGSAWSAGVEKSQKCATDGKAWVFAFKNAQGDLVSWQFFGAKGVSEEVPDSTVRKIAATVRLFKDPSGS